MNFEYASWTRFALFALLASAGACVADTEADAEISDEVIEQAEPIIGGVPATDFPEAALVDMGVNGRIQSACSGAVIAPRVVLTAGHCVFGFNFFRVTTPFAGNQRAESRRGEVFDYTVQSQTVDPNRHDVGVIILDTPINLSTYPTLASSKVPDGTQVLNIGRIQDGRFSNSQLFKSQPIAVRDGARIGFPLSYSAVERIQSGDSGGPDVLVGTHTIVAVNSGGGGGTAVLARVDLLFDFLQRKIAENGGPGNTDGGATPPPEPEPPGGDQEPPAATQEAEPNNTFDRPNPLAGSVGGSVAGSDQDWFTWSIEGQRPYEVKLQSSGDAEIQMFKQVNGRFFRVANTTPTTISHTSTGSGRYVVAVFTRTGRSQQYTLTLTR